MSLNAYAAGLGLLLALAPEPPAAAQVTVEFVEPARYTDAGDDGYDVAHPLGVLKGHLVRFGARCLAEGEGLELRVVDVDLAGRREWWHGPGYDLRVMRDITWPRVAFAYVWRDATGKVRAEGKARVSDPTYLWRSAYVRGDSDELPYEKAMLRDWFERELCPGAAPGAAVR